VAFAASGAGATRSGIAALVAADPISRGPDDLSLPLLTLRIRVAGIVVNGKPMLSAVDLNELMFNR